MTGLDLILGALAAGAATGVSQTAGNAIGDAATALRRLIARRLAGRDKALSILNPVGVEAESDRVAWSSQLRPELIATGADTDKEILAAAEHVLVLCNTAPTTTNDLRGARGVQTGNFSSQINHF